MTTSTIKQIIIHKYQTMSDDANANPIYNQINSFSNMSSHRVRKIVSMPKVHHSLRCNNRQKQMQINHLKLMPKRESKRKLEGYQRYRFHTQVKNYSPPRINTIQRSETKDRIKKIFLPNLKNFEDFDYEADKINLNKSKQLKEKSNERRGSHDKQTNFPQVKTPQQSSPQRLKQQIVYTQRGQPSHLPVNLKNLRKEQKIYKYIQKAAKSDNGNTHKKVKYDDQDRTVSQFSPTFQKQTNVIFHNFKNKGTIDQTQTQPNLRESIFQSEPLFNLSKIKQNLDNFLMTYVPLNPRFDLKQFIRDPEVQIVTNQRSIFAGKIINNQMEGKGVFITQKQHFQGEFASNLKKVGFQKNKNGVYQGLYELGKRNGNGKFIWRNGETYEGDWRGGKKNGHGIWRSLKGDYYQGEWKDNLQNGKGCYYHKGCSLYRGYFKNSLKQGRGEEEFENGQKYQGSYELGKPHGYGKYTWANGDTYQGYFSKGSREGRGILRKKNGDYYEGEFREDMKHGLGKEIYQKGQYFQGYFEKGLKISGAYFTKDGKKIQSY